MPTRLGYAREKFSHAVGMMATSASSLADRIHDAYMIFHPLRAADFPDELRGEWQALYSALTAAGPILDARGEVSVGSVRNTVDRLSDDELEAIADQIVALDDAVERFLHER